MKFTVKEVMLIIESLADRKRRLTGYNIDAAKDDILQINNLINKFQKEFVGETKIKKVKVYRNGTK